MQHPSFVGRVLYIVIIVMLILLGTSCSASSVKDKERQPDEAMVNLIYYTLGEPDKDLQLVNDKINEILAKKIGVTITYVKVGWQEYEKRLNTMISAGTPFDVAFASDFTAYAKRGAWLRLDNYLSTVGKDMYDIIDPVFWQGVRMDDGGIYGIPTNKELAVRQQWTYPDELIKKYDIDISNYNTLESLDPLLQMIKLQEPDYLPMMLDKDSQNFFALYGYEYVIDKKLPLMVQSLDPNSQVVSIFETKKARQVLDTLRHYYKEGYINEDAALRENQELERGLKVFWKASEGGPLAENTWSKFRGYKVMAHPVTPELVTTEGLRGGIMAVSSGTKHPVESVKFLNLLNTDPELRNLFNYGIEGVHYTLDDRDQVVPIPPKDESGNAIPGASPNYAGVTYTQGNWFILNTVGGQFPDPLNKWDQFRSSNARVVKSSMLGFTPDLSMMPVQMQNIEMVWQKYYPSLMTGSVDVNTELPKFNQELKQAGLDKVKAEVQKQLNAWRITHEQRL